MGTLYVVGTPIGNLDDLSHRAQRILAEVSVVLAEDTRITRRLMARYGLRTRLTSFHAHTPPARRAALVAALDAGDAALVTDAGTPGVSDPGDTFVRAALDAGHTVVAVPGPSAPAAALSVSGLPASGYTFLGFLPRRSADRRTALAAVRDVPLTLVLFEAPHRLRATLADLVATLGDRTAVVCRELTKLHEEVWHGTLTQAAAEWAAREPRGEYTLVVAGSDLLPERWDEPGVRQALAEAHAAGTGRREASRRVAAEAGWAARDVYRLWPATL